MGIKILLFYLLVINSISIDKDILSRDFHKCYEYFPEIDPNLIPTENCTVHTPNLKTFEYGSKCCKMFYSINPLGDYKEKHGEKWRQELMKAFEITKERELDEIIKLRYQPYQINECHVLNKEFINFELYIKSFSSIGGIITYDCGDGGNFYTFRLCTNRRKRYSGKRYYRL